jgi:mannose-6-phosphate isomerase-like protein (cupin superfamily)
MEKEYSYTTRLNILFDQLKKIDLVPVIRDCKDSWFNQTLTRVNDSVIRLGIVKGEYHWHKHDTDDEFFFVLEGQLIIDLETESVVLDPWQGFTVPRGILHKTRAGVKTIMLMVETSSIVPTGD